ADVVGAQPRIAIDAVEPEHLFVERTGALERVYVQRGFQNAEKVGHRLTLPPSFRGRAQLRARNPYSLTCDYRFRAPAFGRPRNAGGAPPKPAPLRASVRAPAGSPRWRRRSHAAARKPRGSARCNRGRRGNSPSDRKTAAARGSTYRRAS